MSNFLKNAVKILPIIENSENKLIIYTEFDGMFEVNERLFIMVNTSTSTEYEALDSYYNSGTTQYKIGYSLLEKNGNKLKLDIDYDQLPSEIISGNTLNDTCYIGKIYMKNLTISGGTLNGVMLHNVKFNISNYSNLTWKQGIIFSVSENTISNLYFRNKYTSTDLILKSEIINGIVESYYTKNNYNIGLSVINLSEDTYTLTDCNVYDGCFNKCSFTILILSNNYIYGGYLNNCLIGNKYIIDGGYLYNSTMSSNSFDVIKWVNGTWDSNWNGIGTNPFNSINWVNGTWKKGIFPFTSTWVDGRFIDGIFKGKNWFNGNFNGGVFDEFSTWVDGNFNGGAITGSTWLNGTFNNGTISAVTWTDGTFNNGTMKYCNWVKGIFNNGTINYSNWSGGSFYNGTISDSIWYDGSFYGGTISGSSWYDGSFYGGTIQDKCEWWTGKFYNGNIFDSLWINGEMYYGVVTKLTWKNGLWYDGIANSIEFSGGTWYNGIFNSGSFYQGDWLNGSFNDGYFGDNSLLAIWYNGIFYFGTFNSLDWYNGIFYNGLISKTDSIPIQYRINRDYVPYNSNGIETSS